MRAPLRAVLSKEFLQAPHPPFAWGVGSWKALLACGHTLTRSARIGKRARCKDCL